MLGQQVFGGHGYIREWGQEQLVRDVRITQIYEGTNGIQALDLAGRKLVADGGALYRAFAAEMRADLDTAGEFAAPLAAALDNLDALSDWLIERGRRDPREIGAASVEYLQAVRLHRLRLAVGAHGAASPWPARRRRSSTPPSWPPRASTSPACCRASTP